MRRVDFRRPGAEARDELGAIQVRSDCDPVDGERCTGFGYHLKEELIRWIGRREVKKYCLLRWEY